MRLTVRVHPRSRRPGVGGEHDGALVVRVREPAVDGRATAAVLEALADALGVARRDVLLIRGSTSRTKTVEVPDSAAAAVTQLRSLQGS
ncbi:DUF167 domain-containing protein [Spongisporangium articulatum]|uniref:UPF0235 protein ACIB24_22580 n=1 Tax=Spongisporangium articulatum TaxID=3362603 RepID=A0ABW8AVH1_9ACTN